MRKLVLACLLCFITVSSALATLKFSGRGNSLQFDTADFPPNMKANYEIFKAKCTKCHPQQRTVIAFVSGRMPITGQTFDMDSLKTLSFRMYRKSMTKPDTHISKEEIKPIHILLKYMMEASSH
jgi:hypothetical protein